jgi:hypothetical protein
MKKFILATFFGALLAASANAQTFSQPVRDVNDENRNAVSGICYFGWTTSVGNNSCSPFTVPAGKRLIVRDVSLSCSMPSTSDVPHGMISTALGRYIYFPVQQVQTDGSAKLKIGGRQMFFVAEAGNISVSAWLSASVPAGSNCAAQIFGNLSDTQ